MDLKTQQIQLLQQQLNLLLDTPETGRKDMTGYLHGAPETLFGKCGLEREVCSLLAEGDTFASKLRVVPTNDTTPLQAYITGYNDAGNDHNQADCGECVDAPTVGSPETAIKTRQFGCYAWKTTEINVRNLGMRMNRGEFTDLRASNQPLVEMFSGIFPRNVSGSVVNYLSNEIVFRIQNLAIKAHNVLARHLWDGTGTGGQFAGLEQLISENQVDIDGQACPALNSCICDVEGACITTPQGAAAVFTAIQEAYRKIRRTASQQAFGTVTWAIVMRTEVFEALANLYPCMYYTQGACSTSLSTSVNVEGTALRDLTDRMINEQFLIIDGRRVQVCLDDFIPVEYPDPEVQGQQVSDIYIIPMSYNSNQPALYWEVYDWRNALNQVGNLAGLNNCFWTDRGYYFWTPTCENGCICFQAEIKPRLFLKVPQLAARIANVCLTMNKPYNPVDMEDPFYGQ